MTGKGRPSQLPRITDLAARVRAGENLRVIAAELGVPYRLLAERLRNAGFALTGELFADQQRSDLKTYLSSALLRWREPWMDDAECARVDPDAWFPEKGESPKPAKKICATCPVIQECREYALRNRERNGIWGGTSDADRRKLLKKRAA